ncbi:MAG: hypothetical protein E7523_10375 [Ruminococcaceae bacterium]|nr:hypothetical protein [Oscillospiraceae bacterium]
MEYFYFIFLAVAVFCTYRYMYKDWSLKMKMITASTFLTAGLFLLLTGARYTSPYCCLLFAGLAASFIGDYTLKFNAFGMKGLPGIISFATAHILYISAFAVRVPLTKNTLWLLIPWGIIVTFFVWLGTKKIKINFAGTGPAILVYAMIICVMVLLGLRAGIAVAAHGGIKTLQAIALCIAVVSFMASDCGVCMQMFGSAPDVYIGKHKLNFDRFSSVTYFGAQILLAASMML